MIDEDNPDNDPIIPFRWAWLVTAVMVLGVLAMGAVGVYQVWLKATVRPADDVPVTRGGDER